MPEQYDRHIGEAALLVNRAITAFSGVERSPQQGGYRPIEGNNNFYSRMFAENLVGLRFL